MSDLDKAIRAAADEANWFDLRDTLTAVLDELRQWDNDMPVLADRLRRVIATPLSTGDQSEPTTPAPQPGDLVHLHLANGGIVTGRLYLDPEDDDRERVEDEHGCGWLVEVNGRRRHIEPVTTPARQT